MVPILLLTGFLGSGKTTLLNRLLDTRPHAGPFSEGAGKLAIVVNEFGDVGIDGDLLPDEMTRQIEIKGGCICCRLDEDLAKTLHELEATQPDLSAIIIETTGIAEPLPISWTLAGDALKDKFRLVAVITAVDALEHEKHRPMSVSVDAQVEYADLLAITKLDMAKEEALKGIEKSLRTLNTIAPMITGTGDALARNLWLSLDDPNFETIERNSDDKSGKKATDSSHSFQSLVVPIDSILDFEILTDELEELPASYVRIKGIAKIVDGASGTDEPQMVAFHRVGARVSYEPLPGGSKSIPPTRLVAIGSALDASVLESCISASVLA